MRWQRRVVEKFRDGLGVELGLGGSAPDDSRGGGLAERYCDDGAGCEFGVKMVGQDVGAGAEDAGGDDLIVVHRYIISRSGRKGAEWGVVFFNWVV